MRMRMRMRMRIIYLKVINVWSGFAISRVITLYKHIVVKYYIYRRKCCTHQPSSTVSLVVYSHRGS